MLVPWSLLPFQVSSFFDLGSSRVGVGHWPPWVPPGALVWVPHVLVLVAGPFLDPRGHWPVLLVRSPRLSSPPVIFESFDMVFKCVSLGRWSQSKQSIRHMEAIMRLASDQSIVHDLLSLWPLMHPPNMTPTPSSIDLNTSAPPVRTNHPPSQRILR